ncbi:hypothetical protein AU074_13815 [Pseudomonas sp. ATCC PTA-122608]|uniref:hypothetical protein n=1 Tax=Pseudomonas sp. ATCC PTA-122608 TaxID=1771311 RepID=UPI00096B6BF5|nr:hypothetical protein [Pseudomonas sp. ATCC PTA-122608]OLY72247.1 hypothetical protein AU074_13815 [Pseudomonas sp. ATCC PTA-122608]
MTNINDDIYETADISFRHFSTHKPGARPKPKAAERIIQVSKFSNYKCNPKTLLLFKRFRNPLIAENETIVCHFLCDEILDAHLDRLDIGYRVKTNGHSQWHFQRNWNGCIPCDTELFLREGFSQFFSKIVDLDTGNQWYSENFDSASRYDSAYKPTLTEPAALYTSDILEKIKIYTSQVINPKIEICNEEGTEFLPLIAGMRMTRRPHFLIAIAESEDERLSYFLIMDSVTQKPVGVFTSDNCPERKYFLYVLNAEDMDYQNKMI